MIGLRFQLRTSLYELRPPKMARRDDVASRWKTWLEFIQRYLCKDCYKTFIPRILKSKQYPLKVILDAISFYNLDHTKTDTRLPVKE